MEEAVIEDPGIWSTRAVLVETETLDGLTRETYNVAPVDDTHVHMPALVSTSDIATSFVVFEPRRADATEQERSSGGDLSGKGVHVVMKAECYHSADGPPGAETKKEVLGHLGAAMMALKFEE